MHNKFKLTHLAHKKIITATLFKCSQDDDVTIHIGERITRVCVVTEIEGNN